jgi:tRNA A-37 threonylcarbamoyl transferase component Bud32
VSDGRIQIDLDLDERLRGLSLDPATLNLNADGTVVLSQAPLTGPSAAPGVDEQTFVVGRLPRLDAHVRMGDKIGEGGTAEIRSGLQTSLDREVAVKLLKNLEHDPIRRERLLREARVLGALQHPNIVPVHLLSNDANAEPAIVMQRINGRSWRGYVDGDGTLYAPDGEDDPLEWNLRVLMTVCQATSFAHSQGVMHRDLKLSNVMVGDHGEVYVLDWGLAAAFDRDCVIDAPRAVDETGVQGTPAYMAPEMAGVVVEDLGPQTDVYLLGACLHVLLTGQYRHARGTAMEQLARAWSSQPYAYPDTVPAELAAVANKATAKEPADRFATADELRREISRFLRHRESRVLEDQASNSLALLLAAQVQEDEDEVRRLLGQCRFGFQAALQVWPGNEEAREGLQEALRMAVEFEVSAKNRGAAQALLDEMEAPPPDLVDKVQALRTQERARARELRRLRRTRADEDLGRGRRARGAFSIGLAAMWCFVPLAIRLAEALGKDSPGLIAVLELFGFLATGGAVLVVRRQLMANAAGRRLALSMGGLLAALVPVQTAAVLLGLSRSAVVSMLLLMVASGLGTMAIAQERALLLAAAMFAVSGLGAAATPQWALEFAALASLAGFAAVGSAWMRSDD